MSAPVVAVVGLGFGDEGKGTTVDYLARERGARGVARFGGGPQAAHHVVLPDGRWHAFSQLGAATFVPGVATHLASAMLVEPTNLLVEDGALREKGVHDALARLTLSPRCALVTPLHKLLGQLRELARGELAHGSVGMGVGEAARDRAEGRAITLSDALDEGALAAKLERHVEAGLAQASALAGLDATGEAEASLRRFLPLVRPEALAGRYLSFARVYRPLLQDDAPRLAELTAGAGPLLLEGAQGALLDPVHGFPPHVTKTPTTLDAAAALLEPSGARVERLGVLRLYGHRHGAGPLVTEDPALDQALAEPHNQPGRWQGRFRVGWFDLVAARYAAALNRPLDGLVLTCLDRLSALPVIRLCAAYEHRGPRPPCFDALFAWRALGHGRALITAMHARPRWEPAARAEATRALAACRPARFVELPGWQRDLSGVRSWAELPASARALIDLVQAELGVAVRLVSVGPTWQDKLPAWQVGGASRGGARGPGSVLFARDHAGGTHPRGRGQAAARCPTLAEAGRSRGGGWAQPRAWWRWAQGCLGAGSVGQGERGRTWGLIRRAKRLFQGIAAPAAMARSANASTDARSSVW